LDALGITANGALTSYGRYFIQNEGNLPSPKPIAPCVIQEEQFITPLSSHLSLLWQLKLRLRPSMPGVYPLTKRALHIHNGDPQELIQLLEDGMKNKLSDPTRALILKQPSIRIAEGIILEFSSPAELAQLRRQPVLRKYFETFLSSQTVLIAQKNAKMVFELLTLALAGSARERRGVYVHRNKDQTPTAKTRRTHFPRNPLI